MPLRVSVDVPVASITTGVMFVQLDDPPVGTGTEGAVRSSRTSTGALHAEVLPELSALSVTWNSTWV